MYHVRHRVYDAENGRWTRRDPLGYVDGMGLCEYCRSQPVIGVDPHGKFFWLLIIPAFALLGGCASQPANTPAGCTILDPGGAGVDPCALMKGPCGAGAGGGVICFRQKKVSCMWDNLGAAPGDSILSQCITTHEDDHHKDIICAGYPSGSICRPGFYSITQAAAECRAFGVEIKWLNGARTQCTGPTAVGVSSESKVESRSCAKLHFLILIASRSDAYK